MRVLNQNRRPVRFVMDDTRFLCVSLNAGFAHKMFGVFVDGEAIPVEVRVTAGTPRDASVPRLRDLLRSWIPPEVPSRITTQMLRSASISDLLIAVTAAVTRDAEPEYVKQLQRAMRRAEQGHLLGYRNSRDARAALERCLAAIIYVEAIRNGSRRPVSAVATRLNLTESRAKSLIVGARLAGFLTRPSRGTVGGSTTAAVDRLMAQIYHPMNQGKKS